MMNAFIMSLQIVDKDLQTLEFVFVIYFKICMQLIMKILTLLQSVFDICFLEILSD